MNTPDQERCIKLAEIEGDHTVGAGAPDGPDNPFYDCGAPQPPCLYCGERNWYVDLDGLARIVGCKNCGTKVPISIWKDASVSPGPFCEECAPLAVTTACILCQFKEEMTRRHEEYSKALNRRVDVENVLAAVAAGKREPLTREECKTLAQKLGNA
jgi:hypothetical protein